VTGTCQHCRRRSRASMRSDAAVKLLPGMKGRAELPPPHPATPTGRPRPVMSPRHRLGPAECWWAAQTDENRCRLDGRRGTRRGARVTRRLQRRSPVNAVTTAPSDAASAPGRHQALQLLEPVEDEVDARRHGVEAILHDQQPAVRHRVVCEPPNVGQQAPAPIPRRRRPRACRSEGAVVTSRRPPSSGSPGGRRGGPRSATTRGSCRLPWRPAGRRSSGRAAGRRPRSGLRRSSRRP
jgi:hypothetical protein